MEDTTIILTKQQYIDELSDLKTAYQSARTKKNYNLMREALKDMIYCENMIKTFN
jgi:hypothetical protein